MAPWLVFFGNRYADFSVVQTVNSQKTSRCGVWSQVQNEAFFLRFMFRDSLLYRCLVVFLSMFLKRLNSIISVRKLKNHSNIGRELIGSFFLSRFIFSPPSFFNLREFFYGLDNRIMCWGITKGNCFNAF